MIQPTHSTVRPARGLMRAAVFLWLAAYLLLAGSLDRLHNHPSVVCEHSAASVDGVALVALDAPSAPDANPCPVLLVTLSHAPAPAQDPPTRWDLPGVATSAEPAQAITRPAVTASSRGPPAA